MAAHAALNEIGAPAEGPPAMRTRALARHSPAVQAGERERAVFAGIVDSIEADVIDLAGKVATSGTPAMERRAPLFRALRALGGV